MGVGLALLQETKVTKGIYPRSASGYTIFATDAPSAQQGGIALVWEDAHDAFEVEGLVERTANVLTFQLTTGEARYFIVGCYLPPGDLGGIEDVRTALAATPKGCKPMVMGDFNANLWDPRDKRDESIADMFEGAGLVDLSRRFVQPKVRLKGRQRARRHSWAQHRQGRWITSQPDYIMCREGDVSEFRRASIKTPRFHNSDHRALVGYLRRGRRRKLQLYRRRRRRFPLQLAPGPRTELESLFEELKATVEIPKPRERKENEWVSERTWALIDHRAQLARRGQLSHRGGRALKRQIWASLRQDRQDRAARVGAIIEQELLGGNVQEAFRNLRGWHRDATSTAPRPCFQTMERQTTEREELYREREPPGDTVPVRVDPFDVKDGVPPDAEWRTAVGNRTNGRTGGASFIRAEDMKGWLRGVEREEDPDEEKAKAAQLRGDGRLWRLFVKLMQAIWVRGEIPQQMLWVIVVLIPKGGGDFRGIGLLEPFWKVIESVMDQRLNIIELHDSLHGFRAERGTGTATIEAKLAQQLACLEQQPFYGVFLDLRKAFDAMDRGRCLKILEGYGVGPNMLRLIKLFWDRAVLVCRASGVYGEPFLAGRGVTQGGPLSPKLFNILVDAIVREWLHLLYPDYDTIESIPDELLRTILAIFYADDAYLASRDAEELQRALDILVDLFDRVGLRTNTKKTQAMTCVPGKIRTRLSNASYSRWRMGFQTAEAWDSRPVECTRCGAKLKANSLASHMAKQHEVYVAYELGEEFLEDRDSVTFRTSRSWDAGAGKWKYYCPFPDCPGEATTKWGLRRHFRDRHPRDSVDIDGEGTYTKCEDCGMECTPQAWRRGHGSSKLCREGRERKAQLEAAVQSAEALRKSFSAYGDVLERVEVFKYLGRLLAMNDHDAQAVRAQLRKARKTWMRVGNVLRGENAAPKVCGKFYKAVVQAVLLFGSETWNLNEAMLKQLEGFNIRAAWRMNRVSKPRRHSGAWVYPKNEDALAECGLATIREYIDVRRATIARWVVDRSIYTACTEAERQRGSAPRKWWWEQELSLDSGDATGSLGSDD